MSESSGDSKWKIKELHDILKTEVEAREKCSALYKVKRKIPNEVIITRLNLRLPLPYLRPVKTELQIVPFLSLYEENRTFGPRL